jgi:ribulose-5-phosphate 4-epimerase/fuculose-1-phosphate aldolase
MVGYHPSGSHELHAAVALLAPRFHAILLKNHGIIVGASDPRTALGIVEEMEQNAQLGLMLGPEASFLTAAQCAAIDGSLGRRWE